MFDKEPAKFLATVSQHVDSNVHQDIPASPEAYFIRLGQGSEWKRKGDASIIVVLAVPLAYLNNERIIYKYISDFQPYSWEYIRTNIQLRAWARLLFLNKGISCYGFEVPYTIGESLCANTVFLTKLIKDEPAMHRMTWHPEDYAFSPSESVVAKDGYCFSNPSLLNFRRAKLRFMISKQPHDFVVGASMFGWWGKPYFGHSYLWNYRLRSSPLGMTVRRTLCRSFNWSLAVIIS